MLMFKMLNQNHLILFLLLSGIPEGKVSAPLENHLLEQLFRNYSIYTRPVENQKDPIHVEFNMKLMRVLDVNEKNQKVTTQAYFGMCWDNAFLKWNPEEWDGLETVAVNHAKVWIPDLVLKNNANSEAITVQQGTDIVWLKHNGKNCWYPKVMMTSSFECDVTYFPFDNQNFIFHFGSWSFGESKLHIIKDDSVPMLDKHYLKHSEWTLVHMRKDIIRTQYDSDNYIGILFTYFFSRKPTYSVITAIVPSIGLMSVALFSYLLPPANGERITVLITTLLAFTVFLVEINQSLPRNSDTIPCIQIFYMVTVAECILAFFLTCFLVRVLDKKQNEALPFKVPRWIQRYVFKIDKKCAIRKVHSKIYKGESDMDLPLPANVDARPVSCVSVSLLTGNELHDKQSDDEDLMTWKMLTDWLNRISLRIFTVVFITTACCTFIPSYYRQWKYADIEDEGDHVEGVSIWNHRHHSLNEH